MWIKSICIIINSEQDVRKLIKQFGKEMVLTLYKAGRIKQNVSNLLGYGFKKSILSVARANLRFGHKMLMHLDKRTGNCKQKYVNDSLWSTILQMKDDQLPENKAILNRLYDKFYKAYVAKYKKKFEGIDLEIDPITCDTMINPAYIKTDWDNNCKIVHSFSTILTFKGLGDVSTAYHIDADGNDIHYISPYTGEEFYLDEVIRIKLRHLSHN
jgi:hypothetical protein